MAVRLNHTIVSAKDSAASAAFLADILGLPAPSRFGPFDVVVLDNDVNLDYYETRGKIASQHYALLVSEKEFDEIFARIRERGMPYWADPGKHHAESINHNDSGRGVYFDDPNGHLLEILTRPYGSGGE
jgi:catechol 2,3-dioxygenase-like lactoylglutathione lyase family enzyme